MFPPSGQETFEPGAWYYIVAIPESLEGGYKLRFYKDSDYARKVSEKAVVIKRSVFGNIEKADDGIDFEPQTKSFPETIEEIRESEQITVETCHQINEIFSQFGFPDIKPENLDIQRIINAISLIDGVLSAVLENSHNVITVTKNDGTIIHFDFEDIEEDTETSDNAVSEEAINKLLAHETVLAPNSNTTSKTKKALLLSPFQDSYKVGWRQKGKLTVNKQKLEEVLGPLGYSLDPFVNSSASLEKFSFDYLSNYDLILIITHGGDPDDYGYTTLISGSEIGQFPEEYAYLYDKSEAYCGFSDEFPRYLVQPGWIKAFQEQGKKLPGSIVYVGACHSYEADDLKDYLISNGASAYFGFDQAVPLNSTIDVVPTIDIMYSVVRSLCRGMDAEATFDYSKIDKELWTTAFNLYVNYFLTYGLDPWKFENFKLNPEAKNKSIFLVDPRPKELNANVNENSATLSWKCDYVFDACKYMVHTDGRNFWLDPSLNQSVSVPFDNPGTYSWRVVTNVYARTTTSDEPVVVATYQTDGEPFTVNEQKPAPPQVETFPASVDAQKAFLSGMVTNRSLEGLETGFYYYKLTAQEGSTELSASEKERLVMGGKKVLSAGDYKDYFGIDLTDIEQDSKYLFVAYATDEYSQTGIGEVLSFTTGSPSVHVSSVSLNMSSLELGVGNTATLVATVLPDNASNKKVTWSSSDESKATVSSQGVVKGISKGNAVITVTTEDGGKTAQCHVSVTQSTVHVQSVSLNKTDLVLTVGNSETLVATVLPENAANKSVTWSSSNPSKATVSSTGVVTGVAEGAAVVTATTVDGGKTASCFVTVRQAAQPDPGESGNALIELSCDELDWGDVEIGNNVTKTFTVKNTGTTALNISSVSIVATDNTVNPSYFSILPNSSSTVSPGNSLAFNVTFIPEAECGYYAIVSIKSNASNATEGTSTVWLTGVGIKASSSHSGATPEIVDLGLSVKWASFNLGATKPEEYGDYYAWGETEPYYNSQVPLIWKSGKEAGYSWDSYKWGEDSSLIKYCTDSSRGYNGFTDSKTELDPEDDAAHMALGGKWRMPTDAEWWELRENCTWTWTTLNGVMGELFTASNGNSIFLPAAGYGYCTSFLYADLEGWYRSSTLDATSEDGALVFFFDRISFDRGVSDYYERSHGFSVRPVYAE